MIQFFKKLFGVKKSGPFQHFAVVSKKDKSGRYRYHLYLDGKLAKQDCTIEGWLKP